MIFKVMTSSVNGSFPEAGEKSRMSGSRQKKRSGAGEASSENDYEDDVTDDSFPSVPTACAHYPNSCERETADS